MTARELRNHLITVLERQDEIEVQAMVPDEYQSIVPNATFPSIRVTIGEYLYELVIYSC